MNSTVTLTSEKKLWGIYYSDREHARALGDPLRTTIEATTQIAAEETAAKLGFSHPRAVPIASEMLELMAQIIERQSRHRQAYGHKPSRSIRI